ncbi:conjugal transfer protein TraR [Salmonella enterica subsp. enterica serovar Telelkebir]|nr:conjugal transfer protein TraR [Salmonella enterica subsp. enterica serovar Telelkebir]
MTDFVDRSSDIESGLHETAINAHLNRVKEQAIEAGFCNDCGDEIETERLAAHPDYVTCITCQEIRESKQRRGLV